LSQALVTKNTVVILSVIEELLYRNGLRSALEKKNEEFYKNFLGFVLKKIDSANSQKLLIHVFEQFLAVFNYGSFESSTGIDELLNKIRAKVDKEVKVVKKTVELRAILEALDL
jgi:U3 small nucleolar RNA-associated protein 15